MINEVPIIIFNIFRGDYVDRLLMGFFYYEKTIRTFSNRPLKRELHLINTL